MAKTTRKAAIVLPVRPEDKIKDKRGRGRPYDPKHLQFYDLAELDALIAQKTIAYDHWMTHKDPNKARATLTYIIRALHAKRKLGHVVRDQIDAATTKLTTIRIAADGRYLAGNPR